MAYPASCPGAAAQQILSHTTSQEPFYAHLLRFNVNNRLHTRQSCLGRGCLAHGRHDRKRSSARTNASVTAKTDNWPAITERMVAASTFTFTILLTPQLFKNLANMQAGNRAALAVLSWVGYLTSLLGNTNLLSYFVGKKEMAAARVQLVGALTNGAMLWQIWAAGYMPNTAFWCTVALSGAAAWVNGTKALGLLDRGSLGRQTWHLWGDVTGLIGLASLPQALWMTFVGPATMLPAILASSGGLLLLAANRAGHLPEQMQHLWAAIPGWTATGLFMFQPVAQSVANFANPQTLAGVAVGSIFLSVVSNCLMVPRALLTKDLIWLTGSSWCPLMGWVQLLSMVIGRSEQGNRYLHPFVMAASTVALMLYGILVLVRDSRNKDLPSPLHSIWSLLARPEESVKVPDDQEQVPKTA